MQPKACTGLFAFAETRKLIQILFVFALRAVTDKRYLRLVNYNNVVDHQIKIFWLGYISIFQTSNITLSIYVLDI